MGPSRAASAAGIFFVDGGGWVCSFRLMERWTDGWMKGCLFVAKPGSVQLEVSTCSWNQEANVRRSLYPRGGVSLGEVVDEFLDELI